MIETDNLIIKSFKDFSEEEWDNLLDNFDVTVNYTAWFLNYIEVLNIDSSIINTTFTVFNNNKAIAIVPLYVEKIRDNWQISMGQEPVYAPVFYNGVTSDFILECYSFILNKINQIVKKFECILARFHYSPLLHTESSYNYFIKFGYSSEIPYPDWYTFKAKSTYIVDLLKSKNDLYKQIRKSYKSIINRTRRETKLHILDKSFFDHDLFDLYVQLYYTNKGRIRSLSAFDLDALAIRMGYEVLFLCEYNGKLVGAIALHVHDKKARYNSSVQDHDTVKFIYPNHFLIWEAIVYLKENSFELFEIGEQVDESTELSNKEKNLSYFKAGWGGGLIPYMKTQREFYNV